MKTVRIKHKFREWVKRYLLAEILSSVTTLVAALVAYKLTADQITTALAATWGGNIAYFGYILYSDVNIQRKGKLSLGTRYNKIDFFKNIRALFLEFGVAEIVDSFFIRPALMYYFPIWVHNLSLGVFLAKIIADITFYIPAIIAYELHKRYQRS